jgi:hypothetical protein
VHPTGDQPVNVGAVGVILMIVGLVGILLSMAFWNSWAGPGYWTQRRRRVVHDGPGYVERAPSGSRRRTIVEEDEADVY